MNKKLVLGLVACIALGLSTVVSQNSKYSAVRGKASEGRRAQVSTTTTTKTTRARHASSTAALAAAQEKLRGRSATTLGEESPANSTSVYQCDDLKYSSAFDQDACFREHGRGLLVFGFEIQACNTCGYSSDPNTVKHWYDCVSCHPGSTIVPLYDDCSGACLLDFEAEAFASKFGGALLAHSACSPFKACYQIGDEPVDTIGGGTNDVFPFLESDGAWSQIYQAMEFVHREEGEDRDEKKHIEGSISDEDKDMENVHDSYEYFDAYYYDDEDDERLPLLRDDTEVEKDEKPRTNLMGILASNFFNADYTQEPKLALLYQKFFQLWGAPTGHETRVR